MNAREMNHTESVVDLLLFTISLISGYVISSIIGAGYEVLSKVLNLCVLFLVLGITYYRFKKAKHDADSKK